MVSIESVKLYWEKTSELNSGGFEIERSATGKGDFTDRMVHFARMLATPLFLKKELSQL